MRLLLLILAAHTLADPHLGHHPRAPRSVEQPGVPKEQLGEEDEAFWKAKGDAELEKALRLMTPNTGVAKNIIIFIGEEVYNDIDKRLPLVLKKKKNSDHLILKTIRKCGQWPGDGVSLPTNDLFIDIWISVLIIIFVEMQA